MISGANFRASQKRVHRPAKKTEPFQVVEVVPLGGAVKLAAGEKFLPGDKIKRRVAIGRGHDVETQSVIPQPAFQVFKHGLHGDFFLLHLPVVGHEDLDVGPQFPEGVGQRSGYVRQAAGFGVGHRLRHHKQHFQFFRHVFSFLRCRG